MKWPGRSLDQNPIESLREFMVRDVIRDGSQFSSTEEMKML